MPNEMVKTISSILKNGGTKASYKRVTEDAVNKATPDTWHDFVYRASSDVEYNPNSEAIFGEGGEKQTVIDGNIEASLKIKANQLDAALINFIKAKGDDEWFAVLFSCGKGASGKKLELWAPLCKFRGDLKFTLPGTPRQVDIWIDIYENPALTTSTDKPTWSGAAAVTDYTIAAGEYFKAFEFA